MPPVLAEFFLTVALSETTRTPSRCDSFTAEPAVVLTASPLMIGSSPVTRPPVPPTSLPALERLTPFSNWTIASTGLLGCACASCTSDGLATPAVEPVLWVATVVAENAVARISRAASIAVDAPAENPQRIRQGRARGPKELMRGATSVLRVGRRFAAELSRGGARPLALRDRLAAALPRSSGSRYRASMRQLSGTVQQRLRDLAVCTSFRTPSSGGRASHVHAPWKDAGPLSRAVVRGEGVA